MLLVLLFKIILPHTQCVKQWNFLPLRFYVKLIFGKFRASKTVYHQCHYELSKWFHGKFWWQKNTLICTLFPKSPKVRSFVPRKFNFHFQNSMSVEWNCSFSWFIEFSINLQTPLIQHPKWEMGGVIIVLLLSGCAIIFWDGVYHFTPD